MRLLLMIAASLALLGCQPPKEPLPYPITLGAQGLGALKIGGEFGVGPIAQKLPGFELEKLSKVTPGRVETLLVLKRGETVLAYVFPDREGKKVIRITLCDGTIADARGERVGRPLRSREGLRCDAETCVDAANGALSYRIDPESATVREITLQKL